MGTDQLIEADVPSPTALVMRGQLTVAIDPSGETVVDLEAWTLAYLRAILRANPALHPSEASHR